MTVITDRATVIALLFSILTEYDVARLLICHSIQNISTLECVYCKAILLISNAFVLKTMHPEFCNLTCITKVSNMHASEIQCEPTQQCSLIQTKISHGKNVHSLVSSFFLYYRATSGLRKIEK